MRPRLITLILFLLTARAFAQPAQVTRVLRTFDFEERQLGNVEDLPMNWEKVDGPGLPHYISAHLSTQRHRSGQYSFQFDLNGGGLIYRYPAGLIPVQQGAHYQVQAFVQTTPLPNARARLTSYLVDADGHPLLATLRHSELFSTPPGDQTWHPLSVELSDNTPDASFLVIELELLQPEHFAPSTLGARTLFAQDIHGSAWFDDVTVSQVPEVFMQTDRPGNVFRRSDPLKVDVLVSDRFTDDLVGQLVVRDAAGRMVYQNTAGFELSAAQTVGPGQKKISLLLPPSLGTGWYQATLDMTSAGQFVCRQTLNFVHLADDAPPTLPDQRFGMIAVDLPFAGWSQLPGLLPMIGAGRVKLSVWNKDGDIQEVGRDTFDQLLSQLADLGIVPTACLSDLPPDIKAKLHGGSWPELLSADRAIWQPQLAYLIARHADHLHYWQVGTDGSDLFVQNPQMRQVYAMLYNEFAALTDKPDLAMPWPAWYQLEGNMPATIALYVKPEVLPSQLPLYISDSGSAGNKGFIKPDGSLAAPDNSAAPQNHAQHLSLYLEPISAEKYGREVQIADFAERIVYALSANAERIDLKLPFAVQRVGDQVMSQPEELLLVARTMLITLGGARYCGKIPLATGIEAFLFDKDGQGIIMLWDRGVSAGAIKRLALNLGEHPRSIDMWGNATPLIQPSTPDSTASDGDGKSGGALVQVGSMPIFLIDIDVYLAQMRASVSIDDPKLESSFKPHTRHIRFTNPYHTAISGMVRLRPPTGWTLNPPSMTYSLNPGETFDHEVSIEFPYNSFAGAKIIRADVSVQSDKNNTFSVPIVLKLALSDVGLQTIALRDGADVVVQQIITNYGEKPINYTAYAIYPGQARQERLVIDLRPGATMIKKYRFPSVAPTPNAKARSGIKETDGVRILNNEVAVE
jgi:hypothetical protein